jgi:hypothetical protein
MASQGYWALQGTTLGVEGGAANGGTDEETGIISTADIQQCSVFGGRTRKKRLLEGSE